MNQIIFKKSNPPEVLKIDRQQWIFGNEREKLAIELFLEAIINIIKGISCIILVSAGLITLIMMLLPCLRFIYEFALWSNTRIGNYFN